MIMDFGYGEVMVNVSDRVWVMALWMYNLEGEKQNSGDVRCKV